MTIALSNRRRDQMRDTVQGAKKIAPCPQGYRLIALSCICLMLAWAAPIAQASSATSSVQYDQRSVGQRGFATYYALRFEGRRTASGTTFRNETLSAAHPTLPFGTLVRVTNLVQRTSVVVKIVDRGPALGPLSRGVIIDLSQQAAKRLNMMKPGRVRVDLAVLAPNGMYVGSSLSGTSKLTSYLVLRMDSALTLSMGVEGFPLGDCDIAACSIALTVKDSPPMLGMLLPSFTLRRELPPSELHRESRRT